jgi:Ca2+-binding RTX toxin-like protein
VLVGSDGKDQLYGGDGADLLRASGHADLLDGGAGADVFIFAAGDGADRIQGFERAIDTIRFIGAAAGFGQLAVTGSSDGALIGYGAGDAILLAGIAAGEITEDQFLFG